jgi:hypothetical protein
MPPELQIEKVEHGMLFSFPNRLSTWLKVALGNIIFSINMLFSAPC